MPVLVRGRGRGFLLGVVVLRCLGTKLVGEIGNAPQIEHSLLRIANTDSREEVRQLHQTTRSAASAVLVQDDFSLESCDGGH